MERALKVPVMMRALVFLGLPVIAGCMTDINGDTCVWAPGSDGTCPSDTGGGGDPPPAYHTYTDPHILKLADERVVLARSGGKDYVAQEEFHVLPAGGTEAAAANATGIDMTHSPAVACADICVAAWRPIDHDGRVRSAIRDATGWSTPIVHEGAIRAPAVATFGDLVLVAWSTWETDEGARVELRRLDRRGTVIAEHTLAVGASHGHLSLAATRDGGLVTWQRVEPSTLGPDGYWQTHAWIVAQPLTAEGAPNGPVIEQPITVAESDYYEAAPAAFVDGAYRVVPRELQADASWVVVDPVARTSRIASLGAFEWPRRIRSIVPLADGALLGIGGNNGAIARVRGERIVEDIALPGEYDAPAIALSPSGVQLAYTVQGSLYFDERTDDLAPRIEPVLLAERYEVDTGCAAAGRTSTALTALALLGFVVRRRRATG